MSRVLPADVSEPARFRLARGRRGRRTTSAVVAQPVVAQPVVARPEQHQPEQHQPEQHRLLLRAAVRGWLGVTFVLGWLLLASRLQAQAPGVVEPNGTAEAAQPPLARRQLVDERQWKRGYHGLATLCRLSGLKIHRDLPSWQRVPPEQSLLIVLGGEVRPWVDPYRHARRGGAVLIASDQTVGDLVSRLNIYFATGPFVAASDADAYRDRRDCPRITDWDDSHPITRQLQSIVTNRPGAIQLTGRWLGIRQQVLARLPVTPQQFGRRGTRGYPLAVSSELASGGRVVAVADPSVFSNQMLVLEDNAEFALRCLDWLKDERRLDVLILADGQIADLPDPEGLQVVPPPPDPREVLEALRNLPPEMLVEFGNSVVSAVEDEGVMNELIGHMARSIPDRYYRRWLLLVPTILLCLLALWKLFAQAGSISNARAAKVVERSGPRAVFRHAVERQLAAGELLDQFRRDVSQGQLVPWAQFRTRLSAGSYLATRRLRKRLGRMLRHLRSRNPRYWTPSRLQRLESDVSRWREALATGSLSYRGIRT